MNINEAMRPWKLPHEISLSQEQEDVLSIFYQPILSFSQRDKRVHAHLRQLSSKSDDQQLQENTELYEKARNNNDEEAFLKLIERDPRYLCSELGLYFITLWQYQVGRAIGYRYVRLRIEKFQEQVHKLSEIHPTLLREIRRSLSRGLKAKTSDRKTIQRCKSNLKTVGHGLLKQFDGRGERRIPPLDLVQPWFYAALILFSGLKRAARKSECDREAQINYLEHFRQEISKIPNRGISPDPPYGLLAHIKVIASAIVKIELSSSEKFSVAAILDTSPSDLASHFCASLFGLGVRTVQDCAKLSKRILWASSLDAYAKADPEMILENYPTLSKIFRRK